MQAIQESDCTKETEEGCFRRLVDYLSGSPDQLPNKPQEPPRNTATEAHNLPTLCPLFSNVSLLLPYYGIAKHRENTTPLQIILNFCPFSAYFEPFCPKGQATTDHHHKTSQQGRIGEALHQSSHTRLGATRERERERGGMRSPQAHKKRAPPPIGRAQTTPPPHHKFAPKNQQKSRLGCFEKIFGKIFRGNVSGERKTPRVISTEGGSLNK